MIYDLIIIGGGPAGITAGIYAARQKLNVLLITKNIGGQIAKKAITIENYPGFEEISGMELIQKLKNHLQKFQIKVKTSLVVKVKKQDNDFLVFIEKGESLKAKTVIVASGADPRKLEVPGEKEYIGKGVSYCAVCDAALFKNKTAAIVGGGNTGFETAIALSQWARKIYILEYSSTIKADKINQERIKNIEKVKIITLADLKEIRGKDFVNSITYQDLKSGKKKILRVEGVFVEIGSQPATSFVKGLVGFNERDEIKVNLLTRETKTSGLFSAGDVSEKMPYKQIIIAAGDGARAALSAYKYLFD